MQRTIRWQKFEPDSLPSSPAPGTEFQLSFDQEDPPELPYISKATVDFDAWLGHTNFDLGAKACETMASLPGIEGFEVISRYRFLIYIGQAFDAALVRLELQRILNALPRAQTSPKDVLDSHTRLKVEAIEEVYDGKYPFWAIYVIPNLEIDTFHSDHYDDLYRQINLYRQASDLVGGVLIASHDLQ